MDIFGIAYSLIPSFQTLLIALIPYFFVTRNARSKENTKNRIEKLSELSANLGPIEDQLNHFIGMAGGVDIEYFDQRILDLYNPVRKAYHKARPFLSKTFRDTFGSFSKKIMMIGSEYKNAQMAIMRAPSEYQKHWDNATKFLPQKSLEELQSLFKEISKILK
ncbi:hypothetical protein EHO61_14240 [Leptospira fluminis]|uniref:Uncharacterized protein n=1 Tax=Leptospira fluminis TaxID=2484979 RepID=A0A4R9GPK7_9LEPT|nr:hypothetical protein [Leptospira fluminis]TGK17533.1 hypothetical protein EHO61_14240 [Leptospira fluminis]